MNYCIEDILIRYDNNIMNIYIWVEDNYYFVFEMDLIDD